MKNDIDFQEVELLSAEYIAWEEGFGLWERQHIEKFGWGELLCPDIQYPRFQFPSYGDEARFEIGWDLAFDPLGETPVSLWEWVGWLSAIARKRD